MATASNAAPRTAENQIGGGGAPPARGTSINIEIVTAGMGAHALEEELRKNPHYPFPVLFAVSSYSCDSQSGTADDVIKMWDQN